MSRYPQPLLEFDLGGVITTLLHELVVATAVGNRALLQDEDFIGVAHRAQTVGDDQDRASLHQAIQSGLNQALAF